MSNDMPWKPRVTSTSRLSAVKGYISQRDFKNIPSALQRQLGGVAADGKKQSWKDWAGQKISGRGQGASSQDSERIALFPGWAARRHHLDEVGRTQEAFDVDLFVSGFASSHRAPELASRSQRAFLRLAKGFAALPKLDGSPDVQQLTPSTEDLLASVKLPPRPTEISEDFEVEALERQFQRISSGSQSSLDDSASIDIDFESPPPFVGSSSLPNDIRRLHRNLETRIQPFWSSVLPSRTVRLNLFVSPLEGNDGQPRHNSAKEQDAIDHGPVATRDVTTAVDGSFQVRIRVTWEEMCQHPGALHISFGDPEVEHELLVAATLLPPPLAASTSTPNLHHQPPPPLETKTLHITLTNSPIRVISDIDDTVKVANVISGARAIFHNVFVKDLKDIIVPGMGEWYTSMWQRGVRFHYVSNGPFELLPVLADFFVVSQLPPGSIKLRSYAGRSLFSGLLSAPATRKRAGVQEILQAFPESKFILIGDSGEQDLELYAELARERQDQVLGVFIRDVGTTDVIDDPTGWKVIGAASLGGAPWPRRSWSVSSSRAATPTPTGNEDFFTSAPLSAEPENMVVDVAPRPITPLSSRFPSTPSPAASSTSMWSSNTASSSSTTSSTQRVLEAEKKKNDLQLRVWRARTQMPGHVPLRLFRSPAECIEVQEMLGKRNHEISFKRNVASEFLYGLYPSVVIVSHLSCIYTNKLGPCPQCPATKAKACARSNIGVWARD
ncbi:hypothetical protein B0H10DRAFT_1782443 [Mycena sp. CBHHK59/15]|nr:hypothetical protein B0H10DRAFT_1782443 [Mycena sp. CBHHK59/15]